jgi:hypothetical protein
MHKVCREAVAEIDCGGGKPAAQERGTHGKAWHGIKMRMPVGGSGAGAMRLVEECRELDVRAAECPSHVKSVAGMCAGTAERTAPGCRADEDDIREDEVSRGLGGISTRKRCVVLLSQRAEACKEVLNPSLSAPGA